ncbi:MAG TPA: arylsulfatase [Chitinophagaceae bacterium]
MTFLKLGVASLTLALVSCGSSSQTREKSLASPPNIVIIYADDLGYADLGSYGAKGVETPNIDRLAQNGVRFTDGHCTAATCTPSRYSLLTGSYAFRNNAAILPGDAPLLIRPGTPTLASMLQRAGYTTGVVGKWHLGLGDGSVNWNSEIKPGPLEIGFNYSFLIPATQDRVPTVYVEKHRVANLDPKDPITVSYEHKVGNLPTGLEHPQLLKVKADTQHSNTITNGISRIGYMAGGKSALWVDEDIPFVLLDKTRRFFTENKSKPFFLYLSYTDIHVPREPNARFRNKSTMGKRGDAIAQMDWMTGEVIKQLEELKLSENTLVIFTSDNGPVLDDGYEDEAVELVGEHNPSGPFKGGKYSVFEAGTRVPTIVYWPGQVKPGVSEALVSQVDLLASLARLTGQTLQPSDAPDSYDMLSTWLGKEKKDRPEMLEEAFTFAVRKGEWKYIAPQEKPTPAWMKNKKLESGLSTEPQLYNLKADIGEKHNVAAQHPERLKELQALLQSIRETPTRKGYKKEKPKELSK